MGEHRIECFTSLSSQNVIAYADSYGLDVHKYSVFVCILSENGDRFEAKYGVITPEFEEMHRLSFTHG